MRALDDLQARPGRLQTRLALSPLSAILMGLYIYNDHFSLYIPGTIANVTAGKLGPLGQVSDAMMVGVSLMLAVPALTIFLSSALPRSVSRWLNVGLGIVYTTVQAMTFLGAPSFYQLVVALEILVTLTIVAYALRWQGATRAA